MAARQNGRRPETDEEMAEDVQDFLAYNLLPPMHNVQDNVNDNSAHTPFPGRDATDVADLAEPPERPKSRDPAESPVPSIHATAQRLTKAEVKGLITRIKHWKSDKEDSTAEVSYQISLAEVQRLYLRRLQCRLADHVAKMVKGTMPADDDEWANDLHQYGTFPLLLALFLRLRLRSPLNLPPTVQALQDHDYMNTCAVQRPRDPFLITGERLLDRQVLADTVERHLSPRECRRLVPKTASLRLHWEQDRVPIAEPRSRSRLVAFLLRLTVAAVAAAFLIVPMWLMMLDRDLYPSLITTTVFIVVFGLLMVVVLQDPNSVVSSTAAYAAVLVVFVGLTVT